MASVIKPITAREKGAVAALYLGFIETWEEAYVAGDDRKPANVSLSNVSVSRWKNTPKIKAFRQELEQALSLRERNAYERGLAQGHTDNLLKRGEKAESVTKPAQKGKDSQLVDYTDPTTQKAKLNLMINESDDNKETLDALKMLISTQKDDRDAAKDRKIQRFYTPIRCSQCELYQQQAEKLKSKK